MIQCFKMDYIMMMRKKINKLLELKMILLQVKEITLNNKNYINYTKRENKIFFQNHNL